MRFEWDEQKNRTNYTKHKINFELASMVFRDPLACYRFDRSVDGEERWLAIGRVLERYLLIVVHTYRNREGTEVIRIISARGATSHERKLYEEG